jgi:8-oxo-dGTP diphosphatase
MSAAGRRIVEVVCAIIQRGEKVLLAQRPANKHLALKWEFPGGKVEPGESPWMALQRELQEELGCEVTAPTPLPTTDHDYEHLTARMIPFLCELGAGSPEPTAHEHIALAWVLLGEVAAYDLAEADKPVLEAALRLNKLPPREIEAEPNAKTSEDARCSKT